MAENGIEVRVDIPNFALSLSRFKNEFREKIVRDATRAAANVFREAVIREAPVLRRLRADRVPGALKRGIYIKFKRGDPEQMHYFVSFRKRRNRDTGKIEDPFYGRFLELGWIPRGPRKKFAGGVKSRALARTRHANLRISRPFIQPAFKEASRRALDTFIRKMDSGIRRADRKLSKR
jgi:hypothetical protein